MSPCDPLTFPGASALKTWVNTASLPDWSAMWPFDLSSMLICDVCYCLGGGNMTTDDLWTRNVLMEAERRTELDWISSSSLTTSDPAAGVTAAVWPSVAHQPEMLNATSHAPVVWDQLLDQRTGSGNNSDCSGGATSRVGTDDNANWAKEHDSQTDVRPPSLMSYGVERLPQEVTSEITGSHVFSDVDYHVLRRHVMQGDPDDHVTAKSLDSRKCLVVFSHCVVVCPRACTFMSNCPRVTSEWCHSKQRRTRNVYQRRGSCHIPCSFPHRKVVVKSS